MGVPKGTSHHKGMMVMTGKASCTKAMHINRACPDLLRFVSSLYIYYVKYPYQNIIYYIEKYTFCAYRKPP